MIIVKQFYLTEVCIIIICNLHELDQQNKASKQTNKVLLFFFKPISPPLLYFAIIHFGEEEEGGEGWMELRLHIPPCVSH